MSKKSARSKVEIFRKNFITHARDVSGGYATKADRMRIAKYFSITSGIMGLNYDIPTALRHVTFLVIFLAGKKKAFPPERLVMNEQPSGEYLVAWESRL